MCTPYVYTKCRHKTFVRHIVTLFLWCVSACTTVNSMNDTTFILPFIYASAFIIAFMNSYWCHFHPGFYFPLQLCASPVQLFRQHMHVLLLTPELQHCVDGLLPVSLTANKWECVCEKETLRFTELYSVLCDWYKSALPQI